MSNEDLVQMQRSILWEHAKGNLRAILTTYYNDTARFTKASEVIEKIIADNDDYGTFE